MPSGRSLRPMRTRRRFSAASAASRDGLIAEINVTPLVDVVLVLLIIFMVVTPLLSHGLDLPLPFARHHENKSDVGERLVVSVTSTGALYLDTITLQPEALQASIEEALRRNPGREVLLKGDRSMPYRHARRALEILHRAGVASVELGT